MTVGHLRPIGGLRDLAGRADFVQEIEHHEHRLPVLFPPETPDRLDFYAKHMNLSAGFSATERSYSAAAMSGVPASACREAASSRYIPLTTPPIKGTPVRLTIVLAAAPACLASLYACRPAGLDVPRRSSASNDGLLSEVRVTARLREENIQEVPAAISAVGGDHLDSSYTVNPQGLAQIVPSLYYNSANPRNTAYTIRGLGSNTLSISAANDGIEPGVGFYVDQVYHGRPATAAFDFTDIERIEVLRGPQGTLFGKNTADGAIHIISREPTFEPEGNAEVSFGDFNLMQAKGAISGGIIGDTVAGRLAVQVTKRDGVIDNVSTGQRRTKSATSPCAGSCCSCPPTISSCA